MEVNFVAALTQLTFFYMHRSVARSVYKEYVHICVLYDYLVFAMIRLSLEFVSPDGVTWELNLGAIDLHELLASFAQTLEAQYYAEASKHHCGAGLQSGAHTAQLRRHIDALSRKGLYMESGLLSAASTARLWTNKRCQEANYDVDAICPQCGLEPDTDFHRIWQCCKLDHDDLAIRTTDKHLQQAQDEHGSFACFGSGASSPYPGLTYQHHLCR